MQQNRRRGGAIRTAGGFTLGAALGGLCGVLFAPAAGQVTRRRLAQRARNLQRETARRLGRTQKVLAHKAVEVREAAGEWITDHMPRAHNGRQIRRHAHTN